MKSIVNNENINYFFHLVMIEYAVFHTERDVLNYNAFLKCFNY
jgi:hypothetical protein